MGGPQTLRKVSLKRTTMCGFSEALNVLHYFVEARMIISADSTTFSDLELLSWIFANSKRTASSAIGSSHMSSRTFIANLYNKVQDPNVIGSMTGHVEGSRAFSRYHTIEEKVKKDLVDILG